MLRSVGGSGCYKICLVFEGRALLELKKVALLRPWVPPAPPAGSPRSSCCCARGFPPLIAVHGTPAHHLGDFFCH